MEFLIAHWIIILTMLVHFVQSAEKKCIPRQGDCGVKGKKGPCCNESIYACTKVTTFDGGSYHKSWKCIPKDCDALECKTVKDCCTHKDRVYGGDAGYNGVLPSCEPLGDTGKSYCVYCAKDNYQCKFYGCCSNRKENSDIKCLQYDATRSTCAKDCGFLDKPEKVCPDKDGYLTNLKPFHSCDATQGVTCIKGKKQTCGRHGTSCVDGEIGKQCCPGNVCENGKCKRDCKGQGEPSTPASNECTTSTCCPSRNGKSPHCPTQGVEGFNLCRY